MKLIIVRHGETVENVEGIIQGQTHGTLNEKGKEQAKKVAKRLKNEKIDVAYVSDLQRAKDTAKAILAHHPAVPVIYAKELRERNSSIWEEKRSEERKAFFEKNQIINSFTYKPLHGESTKDVMERVVAFYKKILKKHSKDNVLFVSHGGPLTLFYLHLFQKSMEEYKKYHPKNTAVTILEISDNKKHTVHMLNCVKHLE